MSLSNNETSPSSPPTGQARRRPHLKSRNGCAICKSRRVKCDERKPQCSNCVRREVRCSFLPPTSHAASPGGHFGSSSSASACDATPVTQVPTPSTLGCGHDVPAAPPDIPRTLSLEPASEGLDIDDFSLLHHYTVSTSHTLVMVPGLDTFMRINLPQIAFSNKFLLHSILALAALHLSRFKKIPTSLMASINAQNGPALYMFSTLCFSFTLALGPKPGDFLIVGQHGIAQWLAQLQGMRSLLETQPELFHDDTLAPLFQISVRTLAQSVSRSDHFPELREQIQQAASRDPELEHYSKALDQLSQRFDFAFNHTSRVTQLSPQQVFLWVYQLEDDFIRLLQEEKPIPLVILSYFCILLNGLSSFWWTRGWVEHLLSEIYSSLDEEYRIWMRRPMEETGWIPG
ncbi:C6 zinc finger protein [Penicillium canescens]|uniref:C6 zinc finger protein n=1 Tax=Penicillium canescens TaxID=5083 RepID=UPI0026E08483|nr:C6 zinc finger protein [Penicillium canescens]KAJ6067752.1 C6 zinc finger protein [Penicillium canescens]